MSTNFVFLRFIVIYKPHMILLGIMVKNCNVFCISTSCVSNKIHKARMQSTHCPAWETFEGKIFELISLKPFSSLIRKSHQRPYNLSEQNAGRKMLKVGKAFFCCASIRPKLFKTRDSNFSSIFKSFIDFHIEPLGYNSINVTLAWLACLNSITYGPVYWHKLLERIEWICNSIEEHSTHIVLNSTWFFSSKS